MSVGAALTARAWFELLRIDLIHLRGYRALRRAVARTPTRTVAAEHTAIGDVVDAMRRASFWYFKVPRCLQRSAAVTRLLRRSGIHAQLVVGCHPAPLKGHAWVEVDSDVVSDQLEGLEHFHILDRW